MNDRHPDPAGVPQGASALADVLARAEGDGHAGEFVAELVEGAPRLRCPHCGALALPNATARLWAARLEGASDPSDMASVSALRCPNCRATGVYVARYGPEAGAADAAVLPLLPRPGVPDDAPDRRR